VFAPVDRDWESRSRRWPSSLGTGGNEPGKGRAGFSKNTARVRGGPV
jgi:hypothetical protein